MIELDFACNTLIALGRVFPVSSCPKITIVGGNTDLTVELVFAYMGEIKYRVPNFTLKRGTQTTLKWGETYMIDVERDAPVADSFGIWSDSLLTLKYFIHEHR